jgi:putative CocE/NonD family hydrolase
MPPGRRTIRLLAAPALAVALIAATASPAPARPAAGVHQAAPAPGSVPGAAPAKRPAWKPRAEQYQRSVTTADLPIRMDDGVVLRGDLIRPALANGEPVSTNLPVLLTITAYNKTLLGAGAGAVLAGSDPAYFVKRGYAVLIVDARGTGSSHGTWAAFSAREGRDAAAVVEWAHRAPWSNGRVGMLGASYMGINQIFAAARHPAGLKAIFPQVPGADVYRDVVASGGQVDVGFIPLWLGLVTAAGLVPPAYGIGEPAAGFQMLTDHLMSAAGFTLPLMATAILGGEPAYDGPFYRERSPINVIDRVRVPTFFIGGEFDLFQRGTPLLFERLRTKGVPTRMILGPWDHLEGSSGAEVGRAGYGGLAEVQLRWFDRYVRGGKDARLLDDIAPLTYFEQGTGRWVRTDEWIADDLSARSFRLSGSSGTGSAPGSLTTGRAAPGTTVVPAIPVTGLCTRSANQWTAGVVNAFWPDNPCLADNRWNDYGGPIFQTPPLKRALRIQGPINARLYTSALTGDGMLAVSVSDVAPDGTVSRLTGGWQTVAHRALVRGRSRYLDGRLIQPFHPFTKAAKRPLPRGRVAPVDVEIFPTGAAIRPGHRLRISIQAFDVPHLLSPLPDLPGQLAPLTIHSSARYPSALTLPVRR